MDYKKASHWERLDKIIKSLIYREVVNNDAEFYDSLNIDRSSASLIRNNKRKLPKKAIALLKTKFAINDLFLTEGRLPVFMISEDELEESMADEDEVVYLKTKIKRQEAIIAELRQILLDALKYGRQDLKNKGLLPKDEE